MIKWKLMITTIPYMLFILVIKLILDFVFNFNGILEFSEVGLILTGGIFIMGFMLAGTMADYKESERMPGEIASILETMEDTIQVVCKNYPTLIEKELKSKLLDVSVLIKPWLYKKINIEELFTSFNSCLSIATQMDKATASGFATRFLNELSALRKIINRMNVISITSFLQTGYALLEALIFAIMVILILAKFKSTIAEYTITAAVCMIYFYLYRLIKDIDDPFEYTDSAEKGASEVELFPVDEYIERAKKRIDSL